MCYDIKTQLKTQLKRAIHNQDAQSIKDIQEKLGILGEDFYHVSGFQHPKNFLYTQNLNVIRMQWGLTPQWVKSENQQKEIWNRTLNARGETMYEKNSFRESAKSMRAILDVDGFYDYHEYKNKKYPFYIYHDNGLTLACLYSEWINPDTGECQTTFSIVTCAANPMMTQLHNGTVTGEARMPLILEDSSIDLWLDSTTGQDVVDSLIKPSTLTLMSYPVAALRGKYALGNVPAASDEVEYPSLIYNF